MLMNNRKLHESYEKLDNHIMHYYLQKLILPQSNYFSTLVDLV